MIRSAILKAKVVSSDERESDWRKVLNYGHTIGHALESATGYQVPHGIAIAEGMALEGALAVELSLLDASDLERQNKLIQKAGLELGRRYPTAPMIAAMTQDKKNRDGEVHFVLPRQIGQLAKPIAGTTISVPVKVIAALLERGLR